MSDDRVTFVDPHLPALGSTVGSWLLLGRIDSGSYGVVFRARRADDPESPPVALKLAKQPGDPRFVREAESLQRVRHRGVPRYEDSGQWSSPGGYHHPYIVMELVEGSTLYDGFREQQRSSQDVLRVLAQVAHALVAVHAEGVIHRDVKGDNIRVTPEGRAVLVDFGAGWYLGARPITDTVAPPGTTPYRAPELLRFMWRFRKNYEARWQARASDDLYSLGVTAYRLVTGTYPPPVSETGDERGEPRRLPCPSELATVAPKLEAIILALLSEDREARGTAKEISLAMERAARQVPHEAQRPILPKSVATSSQQETPSSRERASMVPEHRAAPPSLRVRFLWANAAALGGVLVMLIVEGLHSTPAAPELPTRQNVAEERHAPPVDAPEAGVGEESLSSVQDVPRTAVPTHALGLPMPKQPFPGQRKPPCEEVHTVINGGCWAGPIGTRKPPCGKGAFDYEEGCYVPIFNAPRSPTSGEP